MDNSHLAADPAIDPINEELEHIAELMARDIRRYGRALVRLHDLAPGEWADLDGLVDGVPELRARLGHVLEAYGVTLHASWQPCPSPPGRPRSVVVLYSPEWNGIAGTLLIDQRHISGLRD